MKLLLFILALFLFVHSFDREESYYLNAFSKFKTDHSRNYQSPEEETYRYQIFKENVDWINNQNAKKLSYRVGINKFADITNEEYKSLLKFRPSKNQNFRSLKEPKHQNIGDLPKKVDWRDKKAVTSVKDQGDCGSCWTFSTSGAIEGTSAIKKNQLMELTEQQMMDCSWNAPYNNEGCDGGDMRSAMQYIIDIMGIESEKFYPYEDYNGGGRHKCKYTVTKRVTAISGMVNVSEGNETDLACAIVVAPVSVAIDASHKSFQYYEDGIYFEPFCHNKVDDLDHGVLAVGYGDGYYIVKNSWGPGWGWEGYIQMSRNQDNNCGIATYATYATIDS